MMRMASISIFVFATALASCSLQGKLGAQTSSSSTASAGSAASAGSTGSTGSTASTGSTNSSGPTGAHASASDIITVPDMVGMSEAEARQALADLGLIGKIDVKADSGCEWDSDWIGKELAEGTVCHQKPTPGKKIAARVPVQLQLAGSREGDGFTVMPTLIGLHVDDATALLASKGMTDVRVRTSGRCKLPDVVCDQNPKPDLKAYIAHPTELIVGDPEEEP